MCVRVCLFLHIHIMIFMHAPFMFCAWCRVVYQASPSLTLQKSERGAGSFVSPSPSPGGRFMFVYVYLSMNNLFAVQKVLSITPGYHVTTF